MIEVVPLKYGVTFKRVFSEPQVFNQFASDVLGFPIEVDEVHTEYQYPEPVGAVNIKYDLFAEDKEKRTIIEVQHVREDDFFDRFLYYHLIGLVDQVRSYHAYRFQRNVYTIVVLTRQPKPEHLRFSYAVSAMNPVDEFGDTIDIYPHRLVFLVPRAVNEQTPERVRPWLELIADSLDSQVEESAYASDLFQHIIERMRKSNLSPDELARIKDESAWEDVKRKERTEGLEEGLAAGREEGLAAGLATGHAAGRRENSLEIARALLLKGMDATLIASVTGLTVAEIEQLTK